MFDFCLWFCRKLSELVEKYGHQHWSRIAHHLHGRKGKQCRERYQNHLRPDIKVSIAISPDALFLCFSVSVSLFLSLSAM